MRILVLATLATLLFSGCFGLPAGAPDVGDTVTVDWTAYDAATGARLDGGARLTFTIGSGSSGLGFDFEHGVIGHGQDETFRFTSRDDQSRDYRQEVLLNKFIEQPMEGVAPRSAFDAQLGPAVEGQVYPFGFYQLRAVNVTATEVTYRYVVEDGQRDPVDSLGVILISREAGDLLLQQLAPNVGATFTIAQSGSTPFGLAPGPYMTRGEDAEHIVYGYSPVRPSLAHVAIEFEVTVLSIQPAPEETPSGNYGERRSPQLMADPSMFGNTAADGGHAADGHTH